LHFFSLHVVVSSNSIISFLIFNYLVYFNYFLNIFHYFFHDVEQCVQLLLAFKNTLLSCLKYNHVFFRIERCMLTLVIWFVTNGPFVFPFLPKKLQFGSFYCLYFNFSPYSFDFYFLFLPFL